MEEHSQSLFFSITLMLSFGETRNKGKVVGDERH